MKTLIKWRCIVSSPDPLVCINGLGHMIKMAAMLIYGEQPLKNLLLLNRQIDFHETWHVALGTPVHYSLYK